VIRPFYVLLPWACTAQTYAFIAIGSGVVEHVERGWFWGRRR